MLRPRDEWLRRFVKALSADRSVTYSVSHEVFWSCDRFRVRSFMETVDASAMTILASGKLLDGGELIQAFHNRLQDDPRIVANEVTSWMRDRENMDRITC